MSNKEFDAMVGRLRELYKSKTGRDMNPAISGTQALLDLSINLNERVLELESIVYGR